MAALIADIGGTNARFAWVSGTDRTPRDVRIYKSADYATIADALNAYRADVPTDGPPDMGCFAVAAPILGDQVHFTNSPWTFSIAGLQARLGLVKLTVVNDFAALAYSVPHLTPGDLLAVGGGRAVAGAPVGIIGPGTGLGVSALAAGRDGAYVVLATEGGHVTMAACDDREAEVLEYLRSKLGHVSAERVVSGPGLLNLYRTLCHLDGVTPVLVHPDEVAIAAQDGSCPVAVQALDMFFAMLGTVASNLALSLGALGGIMLAGGILPKLAPALTASRFRARFEDKGRYGRWLGQVPTHLIIHPETAFLGLAALVERYRRDA